MENRAIAITLHQIPGIGSRTLMQLDQLVEGDWSRLLSEKGLFKHIKLSKETLQAIENELNYDKIRKHYEILTKSDIQVVMYGEPNYPKPLAQIDNPPFLLYGIGHMELLRDENAIGIVGTRVPTSYGKMVSHRIAADLATFGWTVVSGLAAGIDADAHRGALSVKGKTIAVLGCGVNVIFPKENTKLYEEIAANGLLISEYPPDTQPNKGLFPQRNRIISGISRGIVVVESHNRSGSLITATWALEQGKDVFAVPGSILSAKSAGPHKLIKEGAKLVTSATDIIEELAYPTAIEQITQSLSETAVALSAEEQKLLNIISYTQIHIDEIFLSTNMPRGQIHHTLLMLESKKLIRRLPGYYFIRT